MNLPNALSLFRIVLAAVFTLCMTLWQDLSASCLAIILAFTCFLIASLTDWLDGYLARKLNLITEMGKLLDPLADKILIAAAFVCFTEKGLCPAWVTVIILFREFAVTGLRLLLVEKGVVLPADQWGKWKTVTQMLACGCILAGFSSLGVINTLSNSLILAGTALIYVAAFLTLASGINYFRKGLALLSPA